MWLVSFFYSHGKKGDRLLSISNKVWLLVFLLFGGGNTSIIMGHTQAKGLHSFAISHINSIVFAYSRLCACAVLVLVLLLRFFPRW